jgi:hypothetical protein
MARKHDAEVPAKSTENDLASLRAPIPPKLEIVESADDDLAALRLDPAIFASVAAAAPLVIPVRKPPKQEFIRVRPEANYRITVAAVQFRDGTAADSDEFYVIRNDCCGAGLIGTEANIYTLFVYCTRAGALRLWPVRQPGPDGKHTEWQRSARKAAEAAMRGWVRVVPNMSIGGYELMTAVVKIPDPIWPNLSMAEIIRIALTDRDLIVDNRDHPVLRKLEGRL